MNNPPTDTDPSAAPPPADELISRHFDGDLPPVEHQRLTRLLHDDPQVLLDFVATARVHHGLENLAPARPPVRKNQPLRWIGIGTAAAAAAAVVMGGGWAFFRQPSDGGTQVRVTVTDLNPPPADTTEPAPVSLRKRTVKAAGASALTQPDLEELLGRYYINVSPHGLTVPQALMQLEEAIQAVNILNRPVLNQLRFTVGESVEPGVEDPVVRTPLPPSMTVKAYLETCGLFRQVTRQPGNVVYGPPLEREVADDGSFNTSIYKVPEDFLSGIPQKRTPDAAAVSDPFQVPDAVSAKPTAWSVVTEYFLGEQPEGATATFAPVSSRLVARCLPATQKRLGQRLESFVAHRKTDQIFVTGKIWSMRRTSLPAGFDERTGMILPDPEYQMYMRFLSQTKGVDLFSTPSVIVRSGQRSKIEILQEIAPAVPGAEAENTGLTVGLEAQQCGEFIRLLGTVELGFLGKEVVVGGPSQTSSPSLRMNLREPEVSDGKAHYFPTEYEIWVPDHSTGMFTLDVPLQNSPSGAQVATMNLTATLIDPSGAPLKSKAGPMPEENQNQNQEHPGAENTENPYGVAIPDAVR